jgi:hypothetical protein
VQEYDGIALPNFNVRHLTAKDLTALFFVRKCCRYHDYFSGRTVGLTEPVIVK